MVVGRVTVGGVVPGRHRPARRRQVRGREKIRSPSHVSGQAPPARPPRRGLRRRVRAPVRADAGGRPWRARPASPDDPPPGAVRHDSRPAIVRSYPSACPRSHARRLRSIQERVHAKGMTIEAPGPRSSATTSAAPRPLRRRVRRRRRGRRRRPRHRAESRAPAPGPPHRGHPRGPPAPLPLFEQDQPASALRRFAVASPAPAPPEPSTARAASGRPAPLSDEGQPSGSGGWLAHAPGARAASSRPRRPSRAPPSDPGVGPHRFEAHRDVGLPASRVGVQRQVGLRRAADDLGEVVDEQRPGAHRVVDRRPDGGQSSATSRIRGAPTTHDG